LADFETHLPANQRPVFCNKTAIANRTLDDFAPLKTPQFIRRLLFMLTLKSLNFTQFTVIAPLLVIFQLLTACGAKDEVKIKDYTSISCTSEHRPQNKNIVSVASGYSIFGGAGNVPDYAEVKLGGKYATGKSEITSDAFLPNVTERLRYDGLSSYNIKITSLLEMPEKIEQKQLLKFAQPCQTKNALLENEQLRNEPIRGALYLLASKKSFIVLHGGSYKPKPTTPVKFKLFNPDTKLTEEMTTYLYNIVGSGDFVVAPTTFMGQIQNKISNWGKEEAIANSKKWSLNKNTQTVGGQNYIYFTVTKESDNGGRPTLGEIQSIEFGVGEEQEKD